MDLSVTQLAMRLQCREGSKSFASHRRLYKMESKMAVSRYNATVLRLAAIVVPPVIVVFGRLIYQTDPAKK